MRKIVLTGIFALAASTAFAQTETAPEPTAPAAARPAGQPANLCQELLAYVRGNPPEADAPADAPAGQTAASDQASEGDDAPTGGGGADAQQQPADEDGASAGEETAAAGENPSPAEGASVQPEPAEEGGSAQDVSGQSGPAHGAPDPNSEQAAEGNVENAPQTSSLSAPVPVEATEAGEDIPLNLAQAEELAGANDIAACQQAARKLRLAGAPMPPPLLALTALDLQYQGGGNDEDTPAATPEAPTQQMQPQQ